MTQMYVIGEDSLCCALGARLVTDVLMWSLPASPVNTSGVTKLIASLPRYRNLPQLHPVLCVADTDGKCALHLVTTWLPNPVAGFFLRLAVREAESWLLADADAFADFFQVSLNSIPRRPEELPDPKGKIVNLACKSKRREIRQEVVSAFDRSKPGAGYNLHLGAFASQQWNARRAAENSPSLSRALRRLGELGAHHG